MAVEDVVKRAEKALGYHFTNPALLQQALVHRSYLNENPGYTLGSNERLEYLGDAIVGWIVSEHLYQNYPDASEGTLTAMRAALVRAQTLGRRARSLGLGELLFLSRGEIEEQARSRFRLLGQVFEAILGAIYLDQGPAAAREFALRELRPELARLTSEDTFVDAKSRLQGLAQAQFGVAPSYEVISETGPGHQPHFVIEARLGARVIGRGEGTKKRNAEQAAARLALVTWPPADS